MRIIIANCTVLYEGRLSSKLALAKRMLCLKADGSLSIHCDEKAFKPLNWMNPPCLIEFNNDSIICTNNKKETLTIELVEIIFDNEFMLGDDLGAEPGLIKDGVELELQKLINDRIHILGEGTKVVKKEYYTAIGPIDFLCEDTEQNFLAVEIKRIGEISGVEQLLRYIAQIEKVVVKPVKGILVATKIKPQAKEYAKTKNIDFLEINMDQLYEEKENSLKLF